MPEAPRQFVSRAGEKLRAALEAFALDVRGAVCADFGCNVGGFTDCLLHRGAARVYALDTGYGQLAWRLRKDPRVVVRERTNALHYPVPEPVDVVVIDVAWTGLGLAVPAAMCWLRGPQARIVALLKPHYELAKMLGRKPSGRLSPPRADEVCREVCVRLWQARCPVVAAMRSVLRGKGGNLEYLLLIAPVEPH